MRRIHRAFAAPLCLLVMGSSSCEAPAISRAPAVMFRGDARHSGIFHTRGVDPLGDVLWRFQTDGPVRSSPVVAGDAVYVGSTDGHLYALHRTTGEELWRADAGSPVSSTGAVADGLALFVSRDGVCHAVDAKTGVPRWEFRTGPVHPWAWGMEGWDAYVSSPVVADGLVVFGAGDGSVYALELATGQEVWRFDTEGRIRSTPAIADGIVFVGSADGFVYALGLADGSERWRHATEGASLDSGGFGFDRRSVMGSPAVVDGTVYVGSRDGFMYALDQETGERKWRVSHQVSWAMSSPSVAGDALFAGTSDGLFVHRVDVTTGEEVWRFQAGEYTWSSPALVDSTVYIGDGGGYLRALDAGSGSERWRFRAGDGVYSSPWVADGVVYFGADDGAVYALGSEGIPTYRAVFWDESLANSSILPSLPARVHFEQNGYEVVDAEGLRTFLRDRLEERARSVVVFAMDVVPATVAAEPSDTVLLRRYLEAGGKVVWLGAPPLSIVRNDEGRFLAFDRARPQQLLGVDFGQSNFDYYGSTPTELGRTWGLERGWVSSFSVAPSDAIDVLALDENGLASAWVKGYGGAVGTGFVSVGLQGTTRESLAAALVAAEFGMGGGRRSGATDNAGDGGGS